MVEFERSVSFVNITGEIAVLNIEELATLSKIVTDIQEKIALTHERDALSSHLYNLQNHADDLQAQLNAHQRAFFWRITKPARVVASGLKNTLKSIPGVGLVHKLLWHLKRFGWKATLEKISTRMMMKCMTTNKSLNGTPYM